MTSAIGLMYQLESKSDAAGTPDWQRSLLYLILTLVSKIADYTNQVADAGNESNAFSNVRSDITNIQTDINKLKKWVTDHPGKTVYDAMQDPAYTAVVEQFKKDYAQYSKDTHPSSDPKDPSYNPHWKDYVNDGMDDAIKNAEMIGNTTFDLPVTGSKSIDQMVNGNDPDLGRALFQAASAPDGKGAFDTWGKSGGTDKSGNPVKCLNDISLQFQTFIGNLTQKLSTWGNTLQQIQGAGQNMTTSTGTLMNVIIQHLAEHA